MISACGGSDVGKMRGGFFFFAPSLQLRGTVSSLSRSEGVGGASFNFLRSSCVAFGSGADAASAAPGRDMKSNPKASAAQRFINCIIAGLLIDLFHCPKIVRKPPTYSFTRVEVS